ncbi:MAG: tetratricopeptide repeat protein [Ignavibacteriales bacterium]|nr:tetratricopeptide repeat protein [Ignavibacteriales bacterium]
MKRRFVFAVMTTAILAGCGKLPEAELWKRAETARDNKNADSTLQMCELILKNYPEGTSAPAAMYLIGDVQQNMKHDSRAAIGQYKLFVRKYPDLKQTPVALFLIGFLYNNELKMADSAKAAYQEFIAKYPAHELRGSAEFEILTMGKTPDEIISSEPPTKNQTAAKGMK